MRTNKSNIMYVRKTSMPIWGGVLLIIAGALNLFAGIGMSIAFEAIEDFFDFTGVIFAGAPLIVVGIITIAGGILALMRKIWWVSLIGGILAVLPSPGWLFGVAGLILVSISKPEFDYAEVLEGREERREYVREYGREAGGVASSYQGMNLSRVQPYLSGLDFPASKNEITMFAKTNGAPSEVMSYMNRLPNHEYRSPAEVEEEFSKIS